MLSKGLSSESARIIAHEFRLQDIVELWLKASLDFEKLPKLCVINIWELFLALKMRIAHADATLGRIYHCLRIKSKIEAIDVLHFQ